MVRATVITELGEEIQCVMCSEFWPRDPEFFYYSKGKPHSWCKACYVGNPKIVESRKRQREADKGKRMGLPSRQSEAAPAVPTFNSAPLFTALFGPSPTAHPQPEVTP